MSNPGFKQSFRISILLLLAILAFAAAQSASADEGQFQILRARYGTANHFVDVTARLKELARQDVTFRIGNSTFGVDPDHGVVKTLRIYARGPRGEIRMFEYVEGGIVDGAQFTGWGRADWGSEEWNGGWDEGRGGDERRGGDEGQFQILAARYGTARHFVDVTARLKELARQDVTFRMGNSTFGIDPDHGVVKTLRIYARGPGGETRMFEYVEGSVVDGAQFTGWGHGEWGNAEWHGGWDEGRRDRDDRGYERDRDHDRDGDRDRDSRRLTIIKAVYGEGRHSRDVTGILRSNIRDGRLEFPVNNDSLGGDPAHGVHKTLWVSYSVGGRDPQEVRVDEGNRIVLP
jgi:hypothetical protein